MKTKFSVGSICAGTLALMCGGELRENIAPDRMVSSICTDSREADADTVFVALRGERVDGHDYIPVALAAGCRCIICEKGSKAMEDVGASVIMVSDSELALAYLANTYRKALHAKTVGVTGSVGKTTTKDMIHSVLSKRFHVYKTPGNHNSLVGMPLSVTEIPTDTEWAILEMGMSGFGEVERLSVAAQPDIAVITNIGTAHLEMMGTRENICRAKLEILCGLKNGGVLILNGDEPLLAGIGGKSYRTVYVSAAGKKADFSAQNIRVETDQTLFDIVWAGGTERDLCLHVMGKHNVYAALYAFAIAVMSGMSIDKIRAGLAEFAPEGIRQNRSDCCGVTIFADCYNASPESMIAAIDVLDAYCQKTGRRGIAVLGDMLELGTDSAALHRGVGNHLAASSVKWLFTIGSGGSQIALGARQKGMSTATIRQNRVLDRPNDTLEELKKIVQPGDAILFKASRAVGEEVLIAGLEEYLQLGAK